MKDSHEAVARSNGAVASCRKCNTKLTNAEYYCPECNTPHFPHLKMSLLSPSIKFLAFFVVVVGPITAYALWEVLQRVTFKV